MASGSNYLSSDKSRFTLALQGYVAGATAPTSAVLNAGQIRYDYNVNNGVPGFTTTNNANGVLTINTHSGDYYHQLGFSSNGGIFHHASKGTTGWVEIVKNSGTWGISITGNAATATSLTSNAGSTTQPIYFTGGKPSATSYSLSATINAGDSAYVAYYSGANAISSAKAATGMIMPAHYYHNLYNNNPTTGTTVYVHYYNSSTTSTNSFANLRVKTSSSYKTLAFGGDGNLTWEGHIKATAGYLCSTANGNTVTIGSANTSWTHFQNSESRPFYFSHALWANGDIGYYNTKSYISSNGFHAPKNGGIYWDPYVESSSDASDVSSIYQIASGVAGGTELRINQQNDSTDVINICAPYYIYFNSKKTFDIHDSWLRINESSGFSSGVYFGSGTGGTVRTDNVLQVGASGANFYANSSGNGYFSNTLGIAGTNTNYKLYVNGTSYFTNTTTHNGSIILTKDQQIQFYGKNNNTSPKAQMGYQASVTGVMHSISTGGTYQNSGAFYIWSNGYDGGNDNGGIAIDNEGVTVFGAGDAGSNFTGIFRVINEDDVASGPVFTVKKAGACYFGKGQGYYISNDGSSYTGNAATATTSTTAYQLASIHGNETCIGADGQAGVWINYRNHYGGDTTSGTQITAYYFGDRRGSYKVAALYAGSLWTQGNISVSQGNTTGNGIVLADDGSIVDNNDGYCTMKFTYGVQITNGKASNTNAIQLQQTGKIIINQTASARNAGVIGVYDYTKTALIWSMGNAYNVAADGSGLGNLYGASYGYQGQACIGSKNYAGGHQFLWCDNGTVRAALGSGIWTCGALTVNSVSTNRAVIYQTTVADQPTDYWIGANNANKWSITCRASGDSYFLGLYSNVTGGWRWRCYHSEGYTISDGTLALINNSQNNNYNAMLYIQHKSNNDWGIYIDKSGVDYGIDLVTANDANNAFLTPGNIHGHCIYADSGSNGERQVVVTSATSGMLYLYANTSHKGLYATGYGAGSVIYIDSGGTNFYGMPIANKNRKYYFQQCIVCQSTNAKDGYVGTIVMPFWNPGGTCTISDVNQYGLWYEDKKSHTLTLSSVSALQVNQNAILVKIPATNITDVNSIMWIRLALAVTFT